MSSKFQGITASSFPTYLPKSDKEILFWVTIDVGEVPSFPSQLNATAWEQDCVLTRLLAGGREQPLCMTNLCEPEPKRQKGMMEVESDPELSDSNTLHPRAAFAFSIENHDWWDSGDARRLFAPVSPTSTLRYDTDCRVKDIVLERIELLESVNRAARNWNLIIDKSTGSSKSHYYSEADVFSLRYRSMYLAIALKQFVLNVTGDISTQWTWKRCLQYAIEEMNDVGVEFYSSFATLSRWHRKLARNRYYFYKAPEAKNVCPRFFIDNPDAMEAFKKHGVENIKDLRVEMMLEYVHSQLIPKLIVRRDCALFDDNGDDVQEIAGRQEEITPTTKDEFLQSYGLSTLSITTMARWMHACGFRYKKREALLRGRSREARNHCVQASFTRKYLDDEVRAHRWLQMTLTESKS
ncbi:hypothetical protein MHU86_20559 [Fragilaria crotonensis]|nr:hypothetical protein MHU86_20559 [Fragilaria crotonensis]